MHLKTPRHSNEDAMSTQTQEMTTTHTPITTRIRMAAQRWVSYRKTLQELSQLDDRDLRDIGIGRGDIPHIARDHALSQVPLR